MKRAYWKALAASILLAAVAVGCSAPGSSAGVATQSGPATVVTPQAAPGTVNASVEVEPAQQSEMAFGIAAPIKAVNVKEGDQVKAGQVLIVLDTPHLASAVDAAQGELHSALANQAVQHEGRQTRIQRGHRVLWLGSMPEIRQQADARVLQAQAALDVAKADLAQSTLIAPYDGTVVSVNATTGETVAPNKPVITIGDLQHLQVATTDLSEREIVNVHVGQKASARLKAFSQDLTGKVVAIAPMSQISNGDTVYKVTIELDKQPESLLWGMTGDVTIEAQ